jgi:hypothetical protein
MERTVPIRQFNVISAIKYALLFVPAIVYFFYVYKDGVNIPGQDDYDAILNFLLRYNVAPFKEKIWLLFDQHNEHRILLSRIIYVLYYDFFGNINFRALKFIADTQMIMIFLIMITLIKRLLPQNWLPAAFITSLCLFDLNNWENATFAMAAMQNFGIILLFCCAIMLYNKDKMVFIPLAVLLQTVCVFSSGNGIVASAFIVAFTILNKDKVKVILSTLTFLISSPLYFFHYISPSTGHPATNISKIAIYFFDLSGAHIITHNTTTQLLVGIFVITVLAIVFPINKRFVFKKEALPLVCITGFLLASILVTGIFRCNVSGIEFYPSRYLIYPDFLIAIVFILFVYKIQNKRYLISATVISIVLFLLVYNLNINGNKGSFDGMKDVLTKSTYYYPDSTVAKKIADQACAQKIYCIGQHRQIK